MSRPLFDPRSPGQARLTELIAPQAATIISRTLLQVPTGKQVLFAMGAGQELSEHRSPFVATIHVLDGELHVTLAGHAHELRGEDWLLMPADMPHALRADTDVRFLLTMLRPGDSPGQA